MTIIQHRYRMSFHTPAFLGNAEQSGQWRTPAIKALIRHWWRVAYWASSTGTFDIRAMRRTEGDLFGLAADGDETGSRQSQLRIRLSHWNVGKQKTWVGLDSGGVRHPEVEKSKSISPQLYLGFGPLTYDKQIRQTQLNKGAALEGGEEAVLALAFPDGKERLRLEQALSLLNFLGTLGGRSRNGWGSLTLAPEDDTPDLKATLPPQMLRDWREALALDWPHAVGRDKLGPLIWHTDNLPDWHAVMKRLAEIKISLRTQPAFAFQGKPSGQAEPRHWLSYPVTNHDVVEWKRNNRRLPNTLRFKVRPTAQGQLQGLIYHMPCQPPPEFQPTFKILEEVWTHVHQHLDALKHLHRLSA